MNDVAKTEGAKPVQPLTDEQVAALFAQAETTGRERWRQLGSSNDEGAYIAGVLVALQALGRWERVPGAWIFGALSGDRVFK